MSDKKSYPMVSYSRNDDGTFREVVDGFDPSLPCQVYWLTPEELAGLIHTKDLVMPIYGTKINTLELEVSRLRAALLVLLDFAVAGINMDSSFVEKRIESILGIGSISKVKNGQET